MVRLPEREKGKGKRGRESLIDGLGDGRYPRPLSYILPARDSDTFGIRSAFADPVSRNRPGRRLRSTDSLIARNRSGTRCISSMTTGSKDSPWTKLTGRVSCGATRPERKPAEFSYAAEYSVASSSVTYRPLWFRSAIERTRVVLPVWRAPWSSTAGRCDKAYSRRGKMLRRIMAAI